MSDLNRDLNQIKEKVLFMILLLWLKVEGVFGITIACVINWYFWKLTKGFQSKFSVIREKFTSYLCFVKMHRFRVKCVKLSWIS